MEEQNKIDFLRGPHCRSKDEEIFLKNNTVFQLKCMALNCFKQQKTKHFKTPVYLEEMYSFA